MRIRFDVLYGDEAMFVYPKPRNGKCVTFLIHEDKVIAVPIGGLTLMATEREASPFPVEHTLGTTDEKYASRLMFHMYQMRDNPEIMAMFDDLQVAEHGGFVEL